MWQWLRSKTPPKVECIGRIDIEDRDLPEGKFRNILLKWMPHITKDELNRIIDICRERGRVHLRFTKKAAKGLNRTKNIMVHHEPIVPIQKATCQCEDRHGRYVCSGCSKGLEDNVAWSETNIGLYSDSRERTRLDGPCEAREEVL